LEYAVAEGSSVTSTVNVPANTVDGDFLLAANYVQRIGDTQASANGFTLIGNDPNLTYNGSRMTLWYKRAASEGATVAWTHDNGTWSVWIKRISGVIATGSPLDSGVSYTSVENGQVVTCGAITTNSSAAAVIMAAARVAAATWSLETLTRRIIQEGGGGDCSLFADIQAGAGSSGTHTAKSATTNHYLHGIMLALKPLVVESTYMPDKWWRNTEQPSAHLHKNRIVGY